MLLKNEFAGTWRWDWLWIQLYDLQIWGYILLLELVRLMAFDLIAKKPRLKSLAHALSMNGSLVTCE